MAKHAASPINHAAPMILCRRQFSGCLIAHIALISHHSNAIAAGKNIIKPNMGWLQTAHQIQIASTAP